MKRIIIIAFIIAAATATAQIGHWEKLNPKNNPGERQMHGMASIGQKKALLFGGFYNNKKIGDTWIFDLDKNEWQEIKCKNKPIARSGFGMVQITEKRVLLFGGIDNEFNTYNDFWYFDLDSLNWTEMILEDTLPVSQIERFGMAKINENEVIIYGGMEYKDDGSDFNNKSYIFNFHNKKWKSVAKDVVGSGRYDTYFTKLDNKVLLFGGDRFGHKDDTWIFDPNTNKWEEQGVDKPYEFAASSGDMTYISNGIVLLFGGYFNYVKNSQQVTQDTWIFNYYTKKWYKLLLDVYPPTTVRNKMTLIDNKKVLLFGGCHPDTCRNDTWLFVLDSLKSEVENIIKNKLKFSINYISENEINYEINYVNPLKISLVNINGIAVFSDEITAIDNISNTSVIPIENLPSGIYFVVVNTGDEVLCEKVVIY
jgi:N-acetylneuraminic acid mutarotase